MSTQRKSHESHQNHRTSRTPHGGERATHHTQPREAATTSKAPAPPAPKPQTQAVESPRAPAHKVTPLTQEALSRMTSVIAKQNDGGVPKGSYVAELQSRFDKREAARSRPQHLRQRQRRNGHRRKGGELSLG